MIKLHTTATQCSIYTYHQCFSEQYKPEKPTVQNSKLIPMKLGYNATKIIGNKTFHSKPLYLTAAVYRTYCVVRSNRPKSQYVFYSAVRI